MKEKYFLPFLFCLPLSLKNCLPSYLQKTSVSPGINAVLFWSQRVPVWLEGRVFATRQKWNQQDVVCWEVQTLSFMRWQSSGKRWCFSAWQQYHGGIRKNSGKKRLTDHQVYRCVSRCPSRLTVVAVPLPWNEHHLCFLRVSGFLACTDDLVRRQRVSSIGDWRVSSLALQGIGCSEGLRRKCMVSVWSLEASSLLKRFMGVWRVTSSRPGEDLGSSLCSLYPSTENNFFFFFLS